MQGTEIANLKPPRVLPRQFLAFLLPLYQVFFPGCLPTAQMPFLLVFLKHLFYVYV